MALTTAVTELAEDSACQIVTAGHRVARLCDTCRYIHTDIVVRLETGCDAV